MRGHMDAETLALCAEGLLGRHRSGRIRSHVASCPQCTATQARLTGVPALLAQVPPPPMPPGIAARLDAALSAETARRAARDPGTVPDDSVPAPRPAAMPVPQTATPRARGPRAGRPRGPRLRLPVAARVLATAGVLVAAGGVGYAVARSSPSPTSSSSAGSEAAPSGRSAIRSPGGAASAGGGSAALGPAGGSGQFTVRRSGTRYGKDTFAAQAAALAKVPSAVPVRPKADGGLSLPPPAHSALVQCVERVAGASAVQARKVDMVDEARYRGHPATIIVVQATSGRPPMVYVAGPRCSASDRDVLAQARRPASR